eukprot:5150032-Pleurochrysis_carterae.AAC.2
MAAVGAPLLRFTVASRPSLDLRRRRGSKLDGAGAERCNADRTGEPQDLTVCCKYRASCRHGERGHAGGEAASLVLGADARGEREAPVSHICRIAGMSTSLLPLHSMRWQNLCLRMYRPKCSSYLPPQKVTDESDGCGAKFICECVSAKFEGMGCALYCEDASLSRLQLGVLAVGVREVFVSETRSSIQ